MVVGAPGARPLINASPLSAEDRQPRHAVGPWTRDGEAAIPRSSSKTHAAPAKLASSSPPLASTLARRPVHQTNRAPARREQQPRRPPSLAAGLPLAGAAPPLSNTPNRTLVALDPLPTFLELHQPRRPAAPRDHIARERIFSRVFLQKGNSNSEVTFLFLVNCLENHREIRKMQNQFCWIRGEISYNFCYSCLS
jgi:hypothetical protein